MNWHSATEFFAMGGYGTYVWGAYAMTALVVAAESMLAVQRLRRARRQASAAGEAEVRP